MTRVIRDAVHQADPLALLITAAGIAGVMALSVAQRTREIGIRMALGATRHGIMAMVMRQGLGLIVIGLVIGAVGALMLSKVMKSILFSMPAADPVAFVTVTMLLSVVGGAACFVPAMRATSIDPAMSLRND
jgi:ABC-type antimicrobial peptide transport system permease subunit